MDVNDKIIVKIATLADSSDIVRLVNSVYRGENSKKGWTTEADVLGGIRITEEKVKEMFDSDNNVILKAVADEKIIGCVHLEKMDNYCYWGMLSVDVDFQRFGIGKLLIKECEKYANEIYGCNEVRIKVLHFRSELLKFYYRRGYELTGEKEEFKGPDVFGDAKVDNLYFVTLKKEI